MQDDLDSEKGIFGLKKFMNENLLGQEGGWDIQNWLEKQHAGAERTAIFIANEADKNGEYPFQKGTFDKDSLDRIEMFVLRGAGYGKRGIPIELQKLDSVYPEMGLSHIGRKILLVNDRELPKWATRDLSTEAFLAKGFRRLVTNKPSLAKLETGITNTLRVTGQTKEDVNKIVNACIVDPTALATSGANAGNCIQTTNGFETSNTEDMTTESILNGMRNGTILGAGKWNVNQQWLQHLEDNGILNPNQPFDKRSQEKAATQLRWDQSSCFRTEDGTLIPGCGHPSYIAVPPPLTEDVANAFAVRGFKYEQMIPGILENRRVTV
jgi:hypothetical protein